MEAVLIDLFHVDPSEQGGRGGLDDDLGNGASVPGFRAASSQFHHPAGAMTGPPHEVGRQQLGEGGPQNGASSKALPPPLYRRTAPPASLLARVTLHSLVFGNARAVSELWQR